MCFSPYIYMHQQQVMLTGFHAIGNARHLNNDKQQDYEAQSGCKGNFMATLKAGAFKYTLPAYLGKNQNLASIVQV